MASTRMTRARSKAVLATEQGMGATGLATEQVIAAAGLADDIAREVVDGVEPEEGDTSVIDLSNTLDEVLIRGDGGRGGSLGARHPQASRGHPPPWGPHHGREHRPAGHPPAYQGHRGYLQGRHQPEPVKSVTQFWQSRSRSRL